MKVAMQILRPAAYKTFNYQLSSIVRNSLCQFQLFATNAPTHTQTYGFAKDDNCPSRTPPNR